MTAKLSPQKRARIRELGRKGATQVEIATAIPCSQPTVQRVLAADRVSKRPPKQRPAALTEPVLVDDADTGPMSEEEICASLDSLLRGCVHGAQEARRDGDLDSAIRQTRQATALATARSRLGMADPPPPATPTSEEMAEAGKRAVAKLEAYLQRRREGVPERVSLNELAAMPPERARRFLDLADGRVLEHLEANAEAVGHCEEGIALVPELVRAAVLPPERGGEVAALFTHLRQRWLNDDGEPASVATAEEGRS